MTDINHAERRRLMEEAKAAGGNLVKVWPCVTAAGLGEGSVATISLIVAAYHAGAADERAAILAQIDGLIESERLQAGESTARRASVLGMVFARDMIAVNAKDRSNG